MTIDEAFRNSESIYADVGRLNPSEVKRERMAAFRAGAEWVIAELDAAGENLSDHFAALNRLRHEVSGK